MSKSNTVNEFKSDSIHYNENIKKCKFADESCFIERFNYVFRTRKNGDPELNLVKLEPLDISKISIKQPGAVVNIDLEFINSKLHGLSEAVLIQAKGPYLDPTKPVEFRAKGDLVALIGDYKIEGRVLFLPIVGGGSSNMTISREHVKIRKLAADIKIGQLYIKFENLFNGNKELSDNMNLFLNENWREIWSEVKRPTLAAYEIIFQTLIQNTLDKIPYNELFDE
ncbi:protein takeout-like [Condylostylus longicornis]|uniref:protein takeout-like n=1 Tax=Condylostylus longicornis TaxID=2530218 RepID=UPI00244E586A|nr:protein takeout-like [Condylostylus longicornis]